MKFILPFLITGLVSAQCIEVQLQAQAKAFLDVLGEEVMEVEPEAEYFEKVGKGWVNGFTKGGKRIGTWTFYQDKENWKKVTYKEGDVVFWQRLIAGRRLFELSYNFAILLDTGNINVWELTWNEDRTMDWQLTDVIYNHVSVNENGHFLNDDGTPSSRRTNFGDKYGFGDQFEETIMGVPLK